MAYPAKRKRGIRKREVRDDLEAAKLRAIRFLSYRSRSTEEVREKLTEVGFSPAVIEKVLTRITELGYLDDYEHALTFGRSCIEHRLWGAARVRNALLQKGVDPGTIASALHTLEQEHDFSRVAWRALESRFSPEELRKHSGEKARQKAIGYLLRKGFSWETILAVISSGHDTSI